VPEPRRAALKASFSGGTRVGGGTDGDPLPAFGTVVLLGAVEAAIGAGDVTALTRFVLLLARCNSYALVRVPRAPLLYFAICGAPRF
jgi:hypothetical protein